MRHSDSSAVSDNKFNIMTTFGLQWVWMRTIPDCEIRYRWTNVQELKVTLVILSYMHLSPGAAWRPLPRLQIYCEDMRWVVISTLDKGWNPQVLPPITTHRHWELNTKLCDIAIFFSGFQAVWFSTHNQSKFPNQFWNEKYHTKAHVLDFPTTSITWHRCFYSHIQQSFWTQFSAKTPFSTRL